MIPLCERGNVLPNELAASLRMTELLAEDQQRVHRVSYFDKNGEIVIWVKSPTRFAR